MLRMSNNLPVLIHLLLCDSFCGSRLSLWLRLPSQAPLLFGALRSLYRLHRRSTKAASGGDVKLADRESCKEQQVPGLDGPNGFGTATIALFPSSSKICYTLTAFRIAPANAA